VHGPTEEDLMEAFAAFSFWVQHRDAEVYKILGGFFPCCHWACRLTCGTEGGSICIAFLFFDT
jgi:hypothetical protein